MVEKSLILDTHCAPERIRARSSRLRLRGSTFQQVWPVEALRSGSPTGPTGWANLG